MVNRVSNSDSSAAAPLLPEKSDFAARRLDSARERLDALINWERRDRSAGMRVSLEPATALMAELGLESLPYRCVHVTGSKGKGSVSALIASGLSAAGWRVGRYGSPHVERLNERVVFDGQPIEDAAFAEALEEALAARERGLAAGSAAGEASWFDLMTAACLAALAARGVDWAVVEVGLGGRLDSTNVLRPELCVITQIELEHTQVLGPTLAHIAREKAGILKAGASFVCGLAAPAREGARVAGDGAPEQPEAEQPATVLAEAARRLGIEPVFVPEAQHGPIEARNLALAGAALDALGRRGETGRDERPLGAWLLSAECVAAARLPGRLEWRRRGEVSLLLDGAHVAASLRLVLDELRPAPVPDRLPPVVLSLAKDKSLDALLGALRGRVGRVFCTSLPTGVHLEAPLLCAAAVRLGLEAETWPEAEQALEAACEAAGAGGQVLVTGSLYLVGALRGMTTALAQNSGRIR